MGGRVSGKEGELEGGWRGNVGVKEDGRERYIERVRMREDTEERGRERAREGGVGGGGEGGERGGNTTYKVPRSLRQERGGMIAISITCVGRNGTSFLLLSHTRRQSVNPKCTRIFTQ